MSERKQIKAAFIGDASVGKTSIIYYFEHNEGSTDSRPTVGMSYSSFDLLTTDSERVFLVVSDVAGGESYRDLIPMYFRGNSVFFVTFDLTNRNSFENIQNWVEKARQHCTQEPILILVGNKSDRSEERVVDQKEIDNTLYELSIVKYFETSAVSGENIKQLFHYTINLKDIPSETYSGEVLKENQEPKKNCC